MPAIVWAQYVVCPRCGATEYPRVDDVPLDDGGEFLWKCAAQCGFHARLMTSTTVEFAFAAEAVRIAEGAVMKRQRRVEGD